MAQQFYYKLTNDTLDVTSQNLVEYQPLTGASVSALNALDLQFTKLWVKGPGYATHQELFGFAVDAKFASANIKELHFESVAFDFSAELGKLPQLSMAEFINCRISPLEMRQFYMHQPAMQTLRQERCVDQVLDFQGVKELGFAPNLCFEGFIEVRAQNSGLASLSHFSKGEALEILDVSGSKVTAIEGIRTLKYLRILRANNCQIKSLESQTAFDLPNIYELSISNCPLQNLAGANKLVTLEVLNCENVVGVTTFEQIVDLPLHCIHLSGSGITNDQHDNIQQMRRLQELDLRRTPLANSKDMNNINEDIENNPMILLIGEKPEPLNPEQTQRLEHKMTVTEERRMLRDELVQLRRDILQQTAEIAAIKKREEFQKKEQERQAEHEAKMEKVVDVQLEYMKKMNDLLMKHFGDKAAVAMQ